MSKSIGQILSTLKEAEGLGIDPVEMLAESALFLRKPGQENYPSEVKPHLSAERAMQLHAEGWNLPGQWWERQGQVVFLHPDWNPNDDPQFKGWESVTRERAQQVLDSQPREAPPFFLTAPPRN